MKKDLNEKQKEIVRKDIMNWKQESPEDLSDSEWTEFTRELRGMDSKTLIQMWETNVGEWILSRQDIHSKYEIEDGDERVENEFELLLNPKATTNYGYL